MALVSLEAQGLTARTAVPTIDITFGTRMLPFAVRVSAAATDVITFLGLDGAYSPQRITGNRAILTKHVVRGSTTPLCTTDVALAARVAASSRQWQYRTPTARRSCALVDADREQRDTSTCR